MFVEARAVAMEVAKIALDVPDALLVEGVAEAKRILEATEPDRRGVRNVRASIAVIEAVREFQAKLMEIEAGA